MIKHIFCPVLGSQFIFEPEPRKRNFIIIDECNEVPKDAVAQMISRTKQYATDIVGIVADRQCLSPKDFMTDAQRSIITKFTSERGATITSKSIELTKQFHESRY